MPSQTLNINYQVDCNLFFTAEELCFYYLTDISTVGIRGQRMTEKEIENKILVVTDQLEKRMNFKIPLQRYFETRDFDRDLFMSWGFVKLSYLINKVHKLEGKIGYQNQIIYPSSWISIKKETNKARNMYIVPGQNSDYSALTTQQDYIAIFSTNAFYLGYSNTNSIPNYWNIEYSTGFISVPKDVQDAIGKLASIQVLAILGDIKFPTGVGSSSLGIDGLSESVSNVQSSGKSVYTARITQYAGELKDMDLPRLDNQYANLGNICL